MNDGRRDDMGADPLAQAQALLARGDAQGAMLACQRMLRLRPEDPQALGVLGLAYLGLEDIDQADRALSRAHQLAPFDPALMNALGIVRMRQRLIPAAGRLFHACLALTPYDRDALNNLATLYTSASQPGRAQPYLERLARLLPESADVATRRSDNALALDAVAEAIRLGRKAVRLSPGFTPGRVALADAFEAMGRLKQAKFQYLAILETDAANPTALAQLLSLPESLVPSRHLEGAGRLLRTGRLSDDDRIRLHMGLARHLDAGGHFTNAFAHLQAGNELRLRKRPFDSEAFTQAVDRLIACPSGQWPVPVVAGSDKPLFIVGMPRSGTTLVEQILASHSAVSAGGELPTIINIISELGDGTIPYPEVVAVLGAEERTRLAQKYLDRLDSCAPDAARVTDKMPFNFMHLGLIAALFPGATVIHCRRSALDTCLSCYFTEFNESFEFASDLEKLGRYWLDYRRLMQHWRESLSLRWLDVHYEQVVTNTATTVRGLLKHCGLEWEESCVRYYEREGGVRTPSRWQVRRPIYRDSVGRWRNYGTQLEPLRRVLAAAADEDNVRSSPLSEHRS
jgi:Flp pilus assembly protein TadD